MKFRLTRASRACGLTSLLTPEECERSGLSPVHQRYDRYETFWFDDPRKVPNCDGDTGWWYCHGTDHTVIDGHIRRRFPNDLLGWFVEVPDMIALMRVFDALGEIVITYDIQNPAIRILEIYDDYRE